MVDIIEKYHPYSNYCASLAHKTNHSFIPNCEFSEFNHPRWGLVPCIQAMHDIAEGEEIFVWYGYDLDYCPDWYLLAWELGKEDFLFYRISRKYTIFIFRKFYCSRLNEN